MALPTSVAAAFAEQADFCRRLDAPFTASVVESAATVLGSGSQTGRTIIGWPGEPMADALMMRLTGGLHALARSGSAPQLAALYPPADSEPGSLSSAIAAVLADPALDAALNDWLASAPQTNEVARAGVLMPGLMVIAAQTGLPLRLFELGASAGLNLCLDHFGYRFGAQSIGDHASPVQLSPAWHGPPPPIVPVHITARRGVDLRPLDVADPGVRDRLLAYIWPDQPARLARANAAISLAAAIAPAVDKADAADWAQATIALQSGTTTVVQHSIAFQYFSAAAQARIAAHLATTGAAASAEAPLAWLRYEMDDPAHPTRPTLRLTLWRGGNPSEQLLAHAHPHGASVTWLA